MKEVNLNFKQAGGEVTSDLGQALNILARTIHIANRNWWINIETGGPIQRNIGELLMLTVSELSEAMEGHRKNLMDDKLPYREMFEVELADAVIRICDMADALDYDLGAALVEKCAYNRVRKDHTIESRKKENGKKY